MPPFISTSCTPPLAKWLQSHLHELINRVEKVIMETQDGSVLLMDSPQGKCILKTFVKLRLSKLRRRQVEREIKLHSELQHPYIVDMYACWEDDTHVYMLLEYVPDGDLWSNVAGKVIPESRAVRRVVGPLLEALSFIHAKGIVHRDLKLENVLRTTRAVKLADFGLSIDQLEERPNTRCGTLEAMAPEVLQAMLKSDPNEYKNDPNAPSYDHAVDSWSLGVLTFELLFGHSPFQGTSIGEMKEAIKRGPPLSDILSPEAASFIRACLTVDPNQRPSCSDLLQHAWIRRHYAASLFSKLATTTRRHSSGISQPTDSSPSFARIVGPSASGATTPTTAGTTPRATPTGTPRTRSPVSPVSPTPTDAVANPLVRSSSRLNLVTRPVADRTSPVADGAVPTRLSLGLGNVAAPSAPIPTPVITQSPPGPRGLVRTVSHQRTPSANLSSIHTRLLTGSVPDREALFSSSLSLEALSPSLSVGPEIIPSSGRVPSSSRSSSTRSRGPSSRAGSGIDTSGPSGSSRPPVVRYPSRLGHGGRGTSDVITMQAPSSSRPGPSLPRIPTGPLPASSRTSIQAQGLGTPRSNGRPPTAGSSPTVGLESNTDSSRRGGAGAVAGSVRSSTARVSPTSTASATSQADL